MPLASTVKIILAVEYAEQSTNHRIDPDSLVSLDDLEKFYIPNTDGGAHSAWLESVQHKIENDKISVREIAKGMISHSSNANTEWLLNELGTKNVNNRLDSLGLKNHTEIYNIVSALFVGKKLFPHDSADTLETKLKALGMNEYISATQIIHEKLKKDTLYKKQLGDLSMKIQKIWSDRLPLSLIHI